MPHHGTTSAASASAARTSSAPASASGTFVFAHPLPDLDVTLAEMAERTLAAVRASEPKPDPAFGDFAPIVSLVRCAAFHEGQMIEWGVEHLASLNPNLRLMPQDRPLPVTDAALQVIAKNGWKTLSSIRLPSEVHTRASYTPDLVLVDESAGTALILDLKRALHGYSEAKLSRLRERMLAAAMIAADWLYVEGLAAPVTSVSVAIVDASDETSDHTKGVFALRELDTLIGVEGAGAAMARLRSMFAERIQAAMQEACAALVALPPPVAASLSAAGTASKPVSPAYAAALDALSDPSRRERSDSRAAWRRASVGFARAASG